MSGNRVLLIAMAILCFSCNDEPSEIGNIFKSGDQSYGIAFVDTLTVKTSTVLLDSLPTSWSGMLLAGGYRDDKLGKIQSTAFVQFGVDSYWYPDAEAVFDSVVLLLPYSGYWYGDTTATSTLSVHQVTEEFVLQSLPLYWTDEGNYPYFNASVGLFNTTDFRYTTSSLGTKSFKPKPNSTDTIRIRLSDDLGNAWMREAKTESNFFRAYSEFQQNFQGIAINEKSATAASMYGLSAAGAMIRVYYREYVDEALAPKYKNLTYNSVYYQYNKISGDRTNTPLSSLQPGNKEISTTLTGDEAYVQSGVGILTKVEFPYIKDLYNVNDLLLINNALLVIEPIDETYEPTTQLPEYLTLFQTNETNVPLASLYSDYSTTDQYASITLDNEYGETSGYTFSITQYVQSLVNVNYAGKPALFISTPLTELRSNVSRAVLGGGKHSKYRMRLKIYYTYKK